MKTLYHPQTKAPLQVEEDQVKAFTAAGYTKTVKLDEVKGPAVPQKPATPQGGNKPAAAQVANAPTKEAAPAAQA